MICRDLISFVLSIQYFDLAADVLAENAHLTYKFLTPVGKTFLFLFMSCRNSSQPNFTSAVLSRYKRFKPILPMLAEDYHDLVALSLIREKFAKLP